MDDFKTCVMGRVNESGKPRCWGLEKMICLDGVKCPFYGSIETHYRDPKTGHIKRKEKTDEKINF